MDKGRILVVDDEMHFRYFIRLLLENNGYEVKVARNGIEALSVLQDWTPNCITLDVMMPEKGGLTLYEALCRHELWKTIPVVMLSAVPVSVREHALNILRLSLGDMPEPAACLEKPVSPEQIVSTVQQLLSGNAYTVAHKE